MYSLSEYKSLVFKNDMIKTMHVTCVEYDSQSNYLFVYLETFNFILIKRYIFSIENRTDILSINVCFFPIN